ncbi:hypothetical protein PIB30_101688, partial [Stylosanthes scabra]|nr:hypothetical protein [Stylosanthes scabra]
PWLNFGPRGVPPPPLPTQPKERVMEMEKLENLWWLQCYFYLLCNFYKRTFHSSSEFRSYPTSFCSSLQSAIIMVALTKELFQKALRNFKSFFFCTGYQKLPKNPPLPLTTNHGFSFSTANYQELDNFYSDFTRQWDSSEKHNKKATASNKLIKKKQGLPSCDHAEKREEGDHEKQKDSKKKSTVMEKKLRELEMLETRDRVEHVLDIEEVIHYYSRLNCPLYIEIVDKFFMEIYTDFFAEHVNS